MRNTPRILLVLGGVLALVAAVFVLAERGDSPVATAVPSPAGETERAVLEAPAALAAPDAALPERAAEDGVVAVAPDAATAAAAAAGAIVAGLVIDPTGVPVSGATIDVWRPVARGLELLDREYAAAGSAVARVTSERDGRFQFPAEPAGKYDLSVTAAGFAPTQVRSCLAGAFVTVRLAAGATLLGCVTLVDSGAPVPGARVRGFQYGRGTLFEGNTDDAGRFRFGGLPGARFRLAVEPPGHDVARSETELAIEPGATVEHDVALVAGTIVTGRVTDAASGAPVAGAAVGEDAGLWHPVATGADGRYALRVVLAHPLQKLLVRAAGYGVNDQVLGPPRAGPVEIDFALTRCRRCLGRVVDELGEPVAGAYVAAVGSDYSRDFQRIDWPTAHTGADGRFLVDGLRSDLPHALLVHCPGFGAVTYEFPDDESERSEIDLGDIVLPRAATIAGRVVDELGTPLAGLEVELRGANSDRYRYRTLAPDEAPRPRVWFYVDERGDVTDTHGRFRFDDLCAAAYDVVAHRRNQRLEATAHVPLESGERRTDLVLVLAGRLAIRGTVTDAAGTPLERIVVEIRSEADDRGITAERTLRDGSFAYDGLVAGDYLLIARPPEDSRFAETRAAHVPAGSDRVVIVMQERGG